MAWIEVSPPISGVPVPGQNPGSEQHQTNFRCEKFSKIHTKQTKSSLDTVNHELLGIF